MNSNNIGLVRLKHWTSLLNKRLREVLVKGDIYWILLLAAIIRTIKLSNAFYGTITELTRDLIIEHGMLVDHKLVLLGPGASVGGFSFGAVYYYLLAPFVLLFRQYPVGAVFASTFFSLLSIIILFLLIKLWTNRRSVALLGAFLMAISMFDIQNAYYVSNPNLLPFFILSFLYCLTLWLQGNTKWTVAVGLGISFGVATQLHATALLLLPVVVFACWLLRRPKITWRFAIIAAGCAVILYLPYIAYAVLYNSHQTERLFELGGQSYSWKINIKSIGTVVRFWYSFVFFFNDFFHLPDQNLLLYYILLGVFLLSLVILWWAYRVRRTKFSSGLDPSGRLLLILWFVAGTLMFVFYQKNIPPFYYLALWPLPIFALAFLLEWLWTERKKLCVFIFCFFVITQAAQLFYFYQVVEQKQWAYPLWQSMLTSIAYDSGQEPFNIINSTSNPNYLAYYIQISGVGALLTRNDAKNVYMFYNNDEEETLPSPNLVRFAKQKFLTNKYFTIIKFSRIQQ